MISIISLQEDIAAQPDDFVARMLSRAIDLGSWQMADSADMLYDLVKKDRQLADVTSAALYRWLLDRLSWSDQLWVDYGVRSLASEVADALATLRAIIDQDTAREFMAKFSWFEQRLRGRIYDRRLNLHRLFIYTCAFCQSDERLVNFWLVTAINAAYAEDTWSEQLDLAMLGFKFMPTDKDNELSSEDYAVSGLLAFQRSLAKDDKTRLAEVKQHFLVLQSYFSRAPDYWQKMSSKLRSEIDFKIDLSWLPLPENKNISKQNVYGSFSQPTKAEFDRCLALIRSGKQQTFWQPCYSLLSRYLNYARHCGDSDPFVKTLGNLGNRILKYPISEDILSQLYSFCYEALQFKIGDALNWDLLAKILLKQKHIDAAESAYWEAIRRFPDNTVLRNTLAQLLLARENNQTAEVLLLETKVKFPDNVVCRTALAELWREIGKLAEAETLLLETTVKFPKDVVCRNALADLYLSQGKFPEARQILSETSKNFPNNQICRNIIEIYNHKVDESEKIDTSKMINASYGAKNQAISTSEQSTIAYILKENKKTQDKQAVATEDVLPNAETSVATKKEDNFLSWINERGSILQAIFRYEHFQDIDLKEILLGKYSIDSVAQMALYIFFPDTPEIRTIAMARPQSVVNQAKEIQAASDWRDSVSKLAMRYPEFSRFNIIDNLQKKDFLYAMADLSVPMQDIGSSSHLN